MEAYTLTRQELEDTIEYAKSTILLALADEGFITHEDADMWGHTHTVLLRKKGFFSAISNIWHKTPETQGINFICVKAVPPRQLNPDELLSAKSEPEVKENDTNVLSPDEEVRGT